jgi:hypothetical protein
MSEWKIAKLPQREMDFVCSQKKGVDGSRREPKGAEETIHALEACKQKIGK